MEKDNKTIGKVITGLMNYVNRRVFMTAAALVVFVTTYLLILPAFTQNGKTYCGLEEHKHTAECYEKEETLICNQEERTGHVHDESCYSTEKILTCNLKESAGHAHSENCYDKEGNVICGMEESAGHTHDENCYTTETTLVCGMEEAPDHTHSDSCYDREKKLTCELEEHTHSKACYSNPDADVETQEVWERPLRNIKFTGNWAKDLTEVAKTQMGYRESAKNYIVDEDDNVKGYTRYGEWYGDAYGDWNAMFVSFCINYAYIPREAMPIESDCQKWIETLNQDYRIYYAVNDQHSYQVYTKGESYTPAEGDLVFFNWDDKNDADHVGIITEYKEATENTAAEIKTIEGSTSEGVSEHTYKLTNPSIMGYVKLPENPEYVPDKPAEEKDPADAEDPKEEKKDEKDDDEKSEKNVKTVEGKDYSISVTYAEDAKLPEDVELTARELTGSEYEEKLEEAKTAMGCEQLVYARFFEITFLSDGKEIEPEAPVEVKITCQDASALKGTEEGKAVHFAEEGTELLDIQMESEKNGATSISFQQNSFSVTGIALYQGPAKAPEANGDGASYSDPPPRGNTTGVVVEEPIVGEWYMLYGYNGDSNSYVLPESWPNRGSMNEYAQAPCPKLSQASNQPGGTVKYTGSEDVVWQYVGNQGFVNRHGYYLYMTTHRSGLISYTYSTEFNVSQNPQGWMYPVQYDWNNKAFYNHDDYYNKYNVLMIDNNGYSDHGYPYDYLSSEKVGIPHYLAQVTGLDPINGGHANHPVTSVTGTVALSQPVLYNIDATGDTITGAAGVEYTIRDRNNKIVKTIITGSGVSNTVTGLPEGKYTIEQTKVPAGYVVVPQTSEINIDSNGQGYIGTYFVYKNTDYATDKTGQVIDYVNRIYQIEMSAKSGKYTYDIDPINLFLVVDQSNSMLFPAQLDAVSNGGVRLHNGHPNYNVYNLNQLAEQGIIDKRKVYYMVTDDLLNEKRSAPTSTVYAVFWDGSGWCYQDAAYFSKAYRHFVLGEEENVKENDAYVEFVTSEDAYDSVKHGGGFEKELGGVFKYDNDMPNAEDSKVYQLYTGSVYNRLHELQQATATLAGLMGSLNPQNKLTIETFAKDVYSCQTFTLDSAGILATIQAANNITTTGGTRQDLALKHLYGDYGGDSSSNIHQYNHFTKGEDDYVILITDGAPNASKGEASISDIAYGDGSIAGKIKNIYMSDNDRLITVALSSLNVGGDMLERAASSPASTYYKKVERSGELTEYFVDLFLNEFIHARKVVSSEADIVDVISNSYYITDKDGNALIAGTRINLAGDPDPNGTGVVCYGPYKSPNPDYNPADPESQPTITTDEWYVKWDDQTIGTGAEATAGTEGSVVYTYNNYSSVTGNQTVTLDTNKWYYLQWRSSTDIEIRNPNGGTGGYDDYQNDMLRWDGSKWMFYWRRNNGYHEPSDAISNGHVTKTEIKGTPAAEASPVWKGHVYLKAKEDFMGGNTIDSNQSATVKFEGAETGIELPTPTLNVRLLEMEGFESEETVFLGDDVKDIREKIQTLLDKTVVKKIKSGTGTQLNHWEGATEANGCYNDYFTIHYAVGDLTEAQWKSLMDGETVKIEYDYDDSDSHGAVGYFEFSLKKEVVNGEPSEYKDHQTKVSGKDVEKYTLTVTYTAYLIGQSDEHDHKREEDVHNGSNGPGTEDGKGKDIPNGKGTESVEEIHHVHVIDGEIFLTKEIDDSLISDKDQTFEFELYETNPDTNEAIGNPLRTVSVVVKAREKTGTVKISPLSRNSYIVKEKGSDDYVVKGVSVVTDDTTCNFSETYPSLVFKIGTNKESSGGNPDNNVIIFNAELPKLENSVWVDGKRYVYSKPFKKVSASDVSGGGSGTTTGGGSSGSTGTHKETVTETDYAWSDGTIISTDVSGDQYKKLNDSAETLDMNHTSYGILKQDSGDKDKWSIEWHKWTSKTETVTTPGTITHVPVVLKFNAGDAYNFNAILDGNHYYYDGSTYQIIQNIQIVYGGYGLQITTEQGTVTVNLNGTWDSTIGKNVMEYTIYEKDTVGGSSETTTTWSVDQTTEDAVNSKIPMTTTTREIDVPDAPDPSGEEPEIGGGGTEEVDKVSSTKLSVGHGKIINEAAIYTAKIPVMKLWSDGNSNHTDDVVYVVLYDSAGAPVKDAHDIARMVKLDASNQWKGEFEVSVPEKNYDIAKAGYQIREVVDITPEVKSDRLKAKIENDETDTNIKYVTLAAEKDLVEVGGRAYGVYYTTDGKQLVVKNQAAYELPKTGGPGTSRYTWGGIGMLLAALVLYSFSLRRRRERRLK